jgi:RNA polymerase sigma-70 factor (ECF subfamily)
MLTGPTRDGVADQNAMRSDLLAAVPNLWAFAYSLTHNTASADDLVQDTLVRAWASCDHFKLGTNFRAWLFTILRNQFYSLQRRRRREVEDVEGVHSNRLLISPPEQGAHLDLQDLQKALMALPPMQREALLLVKAQGLSYQESARVCGCALGSVKSRVHRARRHLEELLAIRSPDDIGQDGVTKAVLRAAA